MQTVPTVGIDLPLKALVWQDEGGTTWIARNDPRWLSPRHGVDAGLDRALHAMDDDLAAVAREAAAATAEERWRQGLIIPDNAKGPVYEDLDGADLARQAW